MPSYETAKKSPEKKAPAKPKREAKPKTQEEKVNERLQGVVDDIAALEKDARENGSHDVAKSLVRARRELVLPQDVTIPSVSA